MGFIDLGTPQKDGDVRRATTTNVGDQLRRKYDKNTLFLGELQN